MIPKPRFIIAATLETLSSDLSTLLLAIEIEAKVFTVNENRLKKKRKKKKKID